MFTLGRPPWSSGIFLEGSVGMGQNMSQDVTSILCFCLPITYDLCLEFISILQSLEGLALDRVLPFSKGIDVAANLHLPSLLRLLFGRCLWSSDHHRATEAARSVPHVSRMAGDLGFIELIQSGGMTFSR